jgi:hypothetical protein
VQACAAYGRLVTWAPESAGNRLGPAGQQIGNAPLQWAFSEAAVWCVRNHPPGPKNLVRLAKKPAPGQALPILAHTRAHAVYALRKRPTAVDRAMGRRAEAHRAGEPAGSLAPQRNAPEASVLPVRCAGVVERHGVHRGRGALSRTGGWDRRAGFSRAGDGRTGLAWATPPRSLPITGMYPGLSSPYAEARMRAQPAGSVAAANRHGARPSSPR